MIVVSGNNTLPGHDLMRLFSHFLGGTLAVILGSTATAADERTTFFEKRIRPILVKHCYRCHGAKTAEARLRLDSRAGWKKGGESGRVIVPGNARASLLIRAVSYSDKKLQMPPPDDGGRLTRRQVSDLATWIDKGAIDPRQDPKPTRTGRAAGQAHWAFQPIRRHEVPAGQHPVDFFVDRRLAARDYLKVERADHRTLVRRAVYDLHGLPPSEKHLAGQDLPKLIDTLLASPRYGERWGRHWLDVARYADTKDGVLMYGDKRMRPFAYSYRDYVIRAFNADKPFDRFIHEQLAADRLGLAGDDPALAAMGFLTLGRMFDRNRHDIIDDQIDVVTRGLMGLTTSCSRCHDHKFDPIPTADYYSLYGIFASSIEPLLRPRIAAPTAQGKQFEEKLAQQLAAVQKMADEQHELITSTARQRTGRYLVRIATTAPDINETSIFFLSLLPEQLRPQIVHRWRQRIEQLAVSGHAVFGPWHDLVKVTLAVPGAKPATNALIPSGQVTSLARTWKKQRVGPRVITALVAANPGTLAELAEAYGALLVKSLTDNPANDKDSLKRLLVGQESPTWIPRSQTWFYMSRKDKDKYRGLVSELDILAAKSPNAAPRAMVLNDSEELYDPVIFRRGDPTQPGDPVPRRFLAILSGTARPAFRDGAGRLDLARAITSPRNPLTARVLANRVWMHHIGQPLVETPDDFGLRTSPPTHPGLLDYLASELLRNGWRLKPLHRLIMSSATWNRRSRIPAESRFAKQHRLDPTNLQLWRAHRRRLDLESMRDTLLAVSGKLDLTMFGRSVSITDPANRRRTVYATVERQDIPGVVRNFDFASPDTSAARRIETTVPQQALYAMNSKFVTASSTALATRVESLSEPARIERLHLLVFARSPTNAEATLGLKFARNGGWAAYAQVLLMTNEMMFVD